MAPVGGGASAAWTDAGLAAVAALAVPLFGVVALLPFVVIVVELLD